MEDSKEWARRLFRASPLKQQKYRMLCRFLGPIRPGRYLDAGSDNGVISLLLREQGGEWTSVDLIEETVAAITGLVGERVHQIDGERLPFPDAYFDAALIVDLLEHVETDRELIKDLHRVLRPGGRLIVNVPNPKNGVLRRLRFCLGQTDEEHGHVRPGYDLPHLTAKLSPYFEITEHASYCRFFSELVDTTVTFALQILKRGGRGKKGTVVTGTDIGRLKKSFRLYRLLYPFMAVCVRLDALMPWLHGNMLIAACVRK